MKRISSLDITRGLAIFLMIFIESGDYLSHYTTIYIADVRISMIILIGPMLFLASGASMFFWFRYIEDKKRSFLKVLYRSIILLISLWCIYFLIGDTYRWASWELLPALGAFTILLYGVHKVCSKWQSSYLLLLSLLFFFISVLVQYQFNIREYWGLEYQFFSGIAAIENYGSPHNLAFIPYGLIFAGFYPIFPYFGFVLMGYWLGSVFNQKHNGKTPKEAHYIPALCVILIISGSVLLLLNNFIWHNWWLGYSHFPMKLPAALIYAGANIGIMMLLYRFYDEQNRRIGMIGNFFYSIGQNAIYIYMIGIFSIYTILKLAAFIKLGPNIFTIDYFFTLPEFWINKNDSFKYFRGLFSVPIAFLIGFVINITLFLIFSKPRYKPGDALSDNKKRKIL